jgi:hypothetical protein
LPSRAVVARWLSTIAGCLPWWAMPPHTSTTGFETVRARGNSAEPIDAAARSAKLRRKRFAALISRTGDTSDKINYAYSETTLHCTVAYVYPSTRPSYVGYGAAVLGPIWGAPAVN